MFAHQDDCCRVVSTDSTDIEGHTANRRGRKNILMAREDPTHAGNKQLSYQVKKERLRKLKARRRATIESKECGMGE